MIDIIGIKNPAAAVDWMVTPHMSNNIVNIKMKRVHPLRKSSSKSNINKLTSAEAFLALKKDMTID